MKLSCPECGASIPSENVNIQKMAAVCPDCGAVFQFDPPQAKSKRRKVHQPQALELRDTGEQLEMAFRTNFRLLQDGPFISSALMSMAFGFVTLMLVNQEVLEEMFILPLGFVLITLAALYTATTIAYNKTHIVMDADKIRVSRTPLPSLTQAIDINLHGVTVIRCEETAISKKEGYDLPRYNVWAETVDGNRRTIVKDVTEEYAVFIAQRLNEHLAQNAEDEMDVESERGAVRQANVSRLATNDDAYEIDDDLLNAAAEEALHKQADRGRTR